MAELKKPRSASFLTYDPSRLPTLVGGGGGGGSDDDADDRLTALPDILRLHILSLLPLKSAICASSLSTQWRGLWRYRWPQSGDIRLVPPSSSSSSPEDFVAFADSTLYGLCPDRRIDSLTISLPPGRRYDIELNRWIIHAASFGVADLNVVLFTPIPPPSCGRSRRARRKELAASRTSIMFEALCNCRDLVRLAVSGIRIRRPYFSVVASLEIIVLHDSEMAPSTLKKLIHCCPGLRLLELKRCRKLREISIVNRRHQFANLTIVEGSGVSVVSVRTLGLFCFSFWSNFLQSYRLTDVDDIKDVYMSVGCAAEISQRNFLSNLGKFSDVKVLTLCSFSLQIAVSAKSNIELRMMNRLTELQLIMGTMTESNLSDIYSFLGLCDCTGLEKLFVKLPTRKQHQHVPAAEEEEEESPLIDLRNLRMIKLINCRGLENEMKLLDFLLKNARSLETLLVIDVSGSKLAPNQSARIPSTIFERASQYDDSNFFPVHEFFLVD